MTRVQSPSAAKRLPCGRVLPKGVLGEGTSERRKPAAADLELLQKRLDAYVSHQGLNRSDQRWKIAELILNHSDHLSAQEIVALVQKKHPGIGTATVYRNIKVLCDAHLLRETLNDAQGRVVYEAWDKEHHDHIVCVDCGEIFEFSSPEIEVLQEKLVSKLDFQEVKHRHVVYARCNLLK